VIAGSISLDLKGEEFLREDEVEAILSAEEICSFQLGIWSFAVAYPGLFIQLRFLSSCLLLAE